mgnify:CR=1 FL=1
MENKQDEELFLCPEIDEADSAELASKQKQLDKSLKRHEKRKNRDDEWNHKMDERKQENKVLNPHSFA